MSFNSNNFLLNIDKQTLKIKNKSKKLIPSKPSYLMPSTTYKTLREKESQIIKKENHNKFNNYPKNINIKGHIRNRNYNSKDMSIINNTINNSFKNGYILIKNNINDYRTNRNISNATNPIKNNSKKHYNNFYDLNNDENKENLMNKYNTNYNINNPTFRKDKTIIVNKVTKFIKENKYNTNNFKKLNLKSRFKRRTLSSNMNKIITNINNDTNNILKNNIIDPNSNSLLLNDLIVYHKKNNSVVKNIIKSDSLKKLSLEKIRSSRSFSSSVDNKNIMNNKKLTKNRMINNSILDNENTKYLFNNTTNHFYTRLKQIQPYSKNLNPSNIRQNKNITPVLKNNSLNKSFTTNNFTKKFNLNPNDKLLKNETEKNRIITIDHRGKKQKIKDYFSCIKANNELLSKNCNNIYRKKIKTKSITNLSNLDYQILNKSKDSVLSQNYCPILDEPKKKIYKKILKIDSCTIPGYTLNGIKQKNQDSFFLKKNFLSKDEQFFIGICDGHGLFGDLVSQYISETLPLNVKDISKEELVKAFIDTNNSLINNTKIDCSLSGTTCTSIIITLDKIICANIGNTRAILAKFENGCYNTINLSRDHKPTESDEIKRILSEGGVIKQIYDKTKKEYLGPERIWLKNSDIPGLTMSRSFGDNLAHTVGVINIPEIRAFDYSGGEKFIIIASDSIWQYIDSDECVRIIKDFYEKNMDAVGALNSLVTEAIKRWKKQENKIEDITAVVIFFE